MKVLVITVTYNAIKWAEKCFSSLRNSSVHLDVFVVDNGSTDGTQNFIKERFPEVMFKQSEKNLGFGKANNIGIQYAIDNHYDYVYLLNQDAWVLSDTIEGIIQVSKENPEYGILSPFQMEANMRHIDKGFKVNVCSWHSNNEILDYLYLGTEKKVFDVKEVMAAHWLITRECMLKVGGFSPTFPHYGEDGNYIDRAKYYGFGVGIVPSVKAVHDRANRKESNSKIIYLIYINILRILSNPTNDKYNYVTPLVESIFRYRSLKPIFYLWEIKKRKVEIEKNKEASRKQDCAFLICENRKEK